MASKKVIYDVGSNNGDDIPYYLMKGDLVIAVEANPALCDEINHKFSSEISSGRLIVENCVVTADESNGEVDFYLHNTRHVLSQILPPSDELADRFTKYRLPSRSILDIINEHGAPYYIKIDVEHYDAILLRAIFSEGIQPAYISAECHNMDVFLILSEVGGYKSFKLVDGEKVSSIYADREIKSDSRKESYQHSFPDHSAGPFGNDIDGPWMNAESFTSLLAFAGLGWKDIHATNIELPDPIYQPDIADYMDRLMTIDKLLVYTGKRVFRSLSIRVKQMFTRWR